MATQKIAITVPPVFLKKLDEWSKKMGRTRSRFIVEELEKRLKELEDDEITRMYDEAYGDPRIADKDSQLAEELLGVSAILEEEEQW